MENKTLTAVEWLIDKLYNIKAEDVNSTLEVRLICQQAKAMEKEQMYKCASFWRGKENDIEKPMFDIYYNETYNKLL